MRMMALQCRRGTINRSWPAAGPRHRVGEATPEPSFGIRSSIHLRPHGQAVGLKFTPLTPSQPYTGLNPGWLTLLQLSKAFLVGGAVGGHALRDPALGADARLPDAVADPACLSNGQYLI